MSSKDRLIVALDVDNGDKAINLVEQLARDVKLFKVGLELFSACGPDIVENIKERDCGVFLDLKLHDIPNTIARATARLVELGPFMFNVHALGGFEMMIKCAQAAREGAESLDLEKPKVIAVTILTSTDENGLKKVGINANIKDEVLSLAKLAKDAGLDGVVASAQEAKLIRQKLGRDFIIVTPGVRPAWAAPGDQKRVVTPKEAVACGADFIVIGRPIVEAESPVAAVREILKEIDS